MPSEGAAGAALLPAFFQDRGVFVTGATGFLGKVLVARVLATCPGVRELRVLLRAKRGLSPEDRLHELKRSPVFDSVRSSCPAQLEKLVAVCGDVTLPLLGLQDADLRELQDVSVVFHCAASVHFRESLAAVERQNVRAVLELCDICDQLPSLEALIHVSTAYSNAEHARVEERVYAAPSPADLAALLRVLPASLLDKITPMLISPKPNTYVFSKAVAEASIQQRERRHYAVAIFRPSIVVSSWRWPVPGWVQGASGAGGVLLGFGAGVLRAINGAVAARADLVPVDFVADTMLAAAWDIVTHRTAEVRVYNCSSQENPLTWRQFHARALLMLRTHPFAGALYYPSLLAIKNRFIFNSVQLCLQTAPLHAAGYLARLCGLKLKMGLSTVADHLHVMNDVLSYFTLREWDFSTDNMQRLRERLSDKDREIYHLDIRDVDWDLHVENFVKGTRRHLLSEPDSSLPAARIRLQRLRLLHYTLMLTLSVAALRLLSRVIPAFIRNLPLMVKSRQNMHGRK